MAEVVHAFDVPVFLGGTPYRAQVAGRRDGHLWEGWIEFAAADGSDVRRTRRETTQPDRGALVYWAHGLSGTYLEGALQRALDVRMPRRDTPTPAPFFEAPAPSVVADMPAADRAVLDPFSVAAKGEEMLRAELGALRGWHLRNIVRAYRLADDSVDLDRMTDDQLVSLIVAAVQPA